MPEIDTGKIVKMLEDIRRSIEDINRRDIISEDFALSIARFINILWSSLKVPEDVKVRLIEMTLDYVLRSTLRIKYPAKTSCEEDIPKEYVI